jgi:hypothetical protein
VGLEHRKPAIAGPGIVAGRSRPTCEAHHTGAARESNDDATAAGISRHFHRRDLRLQPEYDWHLECTAARIRPNHRRVTPAQPDPHPVGVQRQRVSPRHPHAYYPAPSVVLRRRGRRFESYRGHQIDLVQTQPDQPVRLFACRRAGKTSGQDTGRTGSILNLSVFRCDRFGVGNRGQTSGEPFFCQVTEQIPVKKCPKGLCEFEPFYDPSCEMYSALNKPWLNILQTAGFAFEAR